MEWTAGNGGDAMPEDMPYVDVDALDELAIPSYWLVWGLQWPGECDAAEAAAAIAPAMIPRDIVGSDVCQVLGCADLYARKHGHRVIFFSDLTSMFAAAGTSWSQLGVDWERALQELRSGKFPLMFLTISEHAYAVICNPARSANPVVTPTRPDGAGDERELVRRAVDRQLAADWPEYVHSLADSGRISRST
jgi:hypothetical protein